MVLPLPALWSNVVGCTGDLDPVAWSSSLWDTIEVIVPVELS